jgi:hypothetical protein
LRGQIAGIVEGSWIVESPRMPEAKAASDLIPIVQFRKGRRRGKRGQSGETGLPSSGDALTAEVERGHLDHEPGPRGLPGVADLWRPRVRRNGDPPFDRNGSGQGRLREAAHMMRGGFAIGDDHPVAAEAEKACEDQRPAKARRTEKESDAPQEEPQERPGGPPG